MLSPVTPNDNFCVMKPLTANPLRFIPCAVKRKMQRKTGRCGFPRRLAARCEKKLMWTPVVRWGRATFRHAANTASETTDVSESIFQRFLWKDQ
jgi:hypothetical protein